MEAALSDVGGLSLVDDLAQAGARSGAAVGGEARAAIDVLLDTLPGPERTAVRLRFGLDPRAASREETSDWMATAGSARRLEEQALRRLRGAAGWQAPPIPTGALDD